MRLPPFPAMTDRKFRRIFPMRSTKITDGGSGRALSKRTKELVKYRRITRPRFKALRKPREVSLTSGIALALGCFLIHKRWLGIQAVLLTGLTI